MVKVTEREHSASILQTMSVHYKCRTKGSYVKQAHLGIKQKKKNLKHPMHPQKSLLHSDSCFWKASRPEREFKTSENCECSLRASCGRRRMTLLWHVPSAIKYIQLLRMYFRLQKDIWNKWVKAVRRWISALLKTTQTPFNIVNLVD